jgi:2-polyprenyl-6-methoxyphenol hydroxylase-like FAD-dependent oxidoreductase
LPDKTPIKTASSVQDIKHVSGGVQVTLANDHVETGDMVLGCDGVYSAVRNFMWEHANKITPELVTVKEKTGKFGI